MESTGWGQSLVLTTASLSSESESKASWPCFRLATQISRLYGPLSPACELIHTAERPFSLLLPAIGSTERSERFRMKSVESQKARSLLMAGAALRRAILCPAESSLVARWFAENWRQPWSSRHSANPYWRIRPADVAKYKEPRLEYNLLGECPSDLTVTKTIAQFELNNHSPPVYLNSSSSIFSPGLSSPTLGRTSSKWNTRELIPPPNYSPILISICKPMCVSQ